MVGRRSSTIVIALGACLALAGALRLGPAAQPAPAQLSADGHPPLVEPRLLALVDELGEQHAPAARSHLGRPPRRFEPGPRTCLVMARCPSEPCVQFVARDARPRLTCDRFPDPGDARMLPVAPP